MKRSLAIGFALILSACAAGGTGPTPKASVLAMEAGLTGAERVALQYVTLPRCAPATRPICSEQSVVDAVKAADMRAYNAVVAAQAAVDADPTAGTTQTKAALAAATAALAAMQAATAPLPQKAQ